MKANPTGWMVAAILLLMGAMMLVDPDGFTTLSDNLSTEFRNFELRARGQMWRYRPRREISFSRTTVRAAGIVLIVLGMLAAAVS